MRAREKRERERKERESSCANEKKEGRDRQVEEVGEKMSSVEQKKIPFREFLVPRPRSIFPLASPRPVPARLMLEMISNRKVACT